MKKEDLNLKMGTPEEAEWKRIKENQVETIRGSLINMAVAKEVLDLAERKIVEEQGRFKNL